MDASRSLDEDAARVAAARVGVARVMGRDDRLSAEETLAYALERFGGRLAEAGGQHKAEVVNARTEAIRLRLGVLDVDPTRAHHADEVVRTCVWFYNDQGWGEEARTCLAEVVPTLRRLAGAAPEWYEGILDSALTYLAMFESGFGRHDAAVVALRELIQLRGEEPNTVADLVRELSELGRWDEALEPAELVVRYWRDADHGVLAPALVRDNLTAGLCALGRVLNGLGRRAEAESVLDDALARLRELVRAENANQPGAGLRVMETVVAQLSELGRWVEALVVAEQLTSGYREFAAGDGYGDRLHPFDAQDGMIRALEIHARILARLGRHAEAARLSDEAARTPVGSFWQIDSE